MSTPPGACSSRYLRGSRPTIRWRFYDKDDNLETPAALTITVRDPNDDDAGDQDNYVMPHATIVVVSTGVIDFTFPSPLTIDITGVHVSV
jgi:hypothetical protein